MKGMLTVQDSSHKIKRAAPSTAVWAVGGMECLGNALPLGTEVLLLEEISRRVAQALGPRTYLLPVFPFGVPASDRRGPGGVDLGYRNLMSVVRDVVRSLYAQGIRSVAVINGLGRVGGSTVAPYGNRSVKTAVRQINYDFPECKAVWVQPLSIAQRELVEILGVPGADGAETALMSRLYPELVRKQPGPEGVPWKLSSEQGAAALDAVVRKSADYIHQTLGELATLAHGDDEQRR